ncbi:MAG: AI-2E family transporter, partial [Deltaproteobacteria bacterium]|nr:AI-2E family transporter [Deltaproteobacteria bacterium]
MSLPPDQPPPPADPPPALIAWQSLFFKTLLLGGTATAALWLLVRLRVVTAPILIGFFIAYALNPIVVRLRRWRVPPILALTVPLIAVLTLAAVFAMVVLPTMAQQLLRVSEHAPARMYNWVLRADPWFQEHAGRSVSEWISYQDLSGAAQAIAREFVGPAQSVLTVVLSSARDIVIGLGRLALVVVVAFFLLDDYERIMARLGDLVPRRRLDEIRRVTGRIGEVLDGFVRGQLMLLALAGSCFTLGMGLLGVPFFLVMGPIAAVLYLVPYVGVVVGCLLTALLTALSDADGGHLLGIVFLFAVFYGADLLFITPRLIGNRVGLPPLAVLLGIIAFGELFGIIGVLIAVPLLACGRILLLEALDRYRHSAAYLG